MAVPPGKTLLTQWIKNTGTDTELRNSDPLAQVYASQPEPPDPQDRRTTAKLWSDIFQNSRPQKPQSASDTNSIDGDHKISSYASQSDEDFPIKRRKRHINPHNPFNSYVVSMRFPSHLREQLEERSLEVERDTTKGVLGETRSGQQQSFIEPSVIHVFKAPKCGLESIKGLQTDRELTRPDGLQPLKPKTHSFFAKRDTSAVSKAAAPSPLSARFKHSQMDPPWRTVHVRPPANWEYTALPRRKRNRVVDSSESSQYLLDDSVVPKFYVPPQIHKPSRVLVGSSQVKAMAVHSLSRPSAKMNEILVDRIGQPKAFDFGQFETRVWSDIYSPDSWRSHVTPEAAEQIYTWIKHQVEHRSKNGDQKPKTRRRRAGYASDDGFVVDDDFDQPDEDDLLIVSGPVGSGKTSAVYAAAKSADAFVFEVPSSVKRTGKELSSMLDGISQNHAVHKAKNVVILIDDGDIVYENEAGGFWASLSRFATTSRRPVIITCTDPRMVAVSNVSYRNIQLPALDLVRVTDLAWLVALSEGHLIDRLRLARLVVSWRGDLRRVLTQLQFWCQMGIGGSPSSEEWVAKDYEFEALKADRVLSKDTWFPVNLEDSASPKASCQDPLFTEIEGRLADISSLTSLPEHASISSFASVQDTLPTSISYLTRQPAEETLSANGALPVSVWTEPIIIPYRGNEPRLHNVFSMESSYGTSSRDLACDVSPYMRHMVASDLRRQLVVQQAMTDQTERGARMTRRALAASGIDCRQYLELSRGSMDVVLNTGYPTTYFAKL